MTSVVNIPTLRTANFGDGVNNRFWRELTNKKIVNISHRPHYITTGSIMCLVNEHSTIFGTGFISSMGDLGGGNFSSKENKCKARPKCVIAVRGPLSRDKLLEFGIECPKVYGDPLLLLPCLYPMYTHITEKYVGVIPHYIDKKSHQLIQLCSCIQNNGYSIKLIDIEVGDKYEKIIDEINTCNYIISSSLHGVIMGIVYKKNTIYTELTDKVFGAGFKFNDFFKSLDITYTPTKYDDKYILKNIIHVDYEVLMNVGNILISHIPFIDNDTKIKLINTYTSFYSSHTYNTRDE